GLPPSLEELLVGLTALLDFPHLRQRAAVVQRGDQFERVEGQLLPIENLLEARSGVLWASVGKLDDPKHESGARVARVGRPRQRVCGALIALTPPNQAVGKLEAALRIVICCARHSAGLVK